MADKITITIESDAGGPLTMAQFIQEMLFHNVPGMKVTVDESDFRDDKRIFHPFSEAKTTLNRMRDEGVTVHIKAQRTPRPEIGETRLYVGGQGALKPVNDRGEITSTPGDASK